MKPLPLCALAAALILGATTTAHPTSVNEPTNDLPIKVGMSTALTGPASALGTGVRTGVNAYFDWVNESGGVQGRPLELIALDDGYEPARTGPNMRALDGEHDVFAVVGNVGTPTAAVAVPIAGELEMPLFGAFTGAGLLRKSPPDRYVVNYRASYAQETAAMVDGLIDGMGLEPSQIAFFTQNDAYGMAGYSGAMKALERRGYKEARALPHGRYPRNTTRVEGGLSTIMDPRHDVRAVIMVGAYRPCARMIQLAKQHGLDAIFLNVSFVGSAALAKELGAAGEGVVVTQVVPHFESDMPGVAHFRSIVPEEEQGFVSLEGYLLARAFVEGLRAVDGELTRESFIDALESGHPVDMGIGDPARLAKTDHQLSDTVWPTVIGSNGQYSSLEDWSELRRFIGGAK